MRYPETPRGDVVDDHHGTKVADPYRWLEDADAPATRAWIGEQNALTEGWLGGEPARTALRERLTALWDHPRAGAPWRRGERWFQLRNSGLQNQDVLWVMDACDAEGRVLLDPNTLSRDGTVSLSGTVASDDGALLAYATSAAGSDWMTWRVRRVADGSDTDDVVEWSKFSGASWLPDGSGFFYADYVPPPAAATFAQANTDQRLRLHRLGADQADDAIVYARPDQPEWGFDPHVTDDGRWLVLHVWHGTRPQNRLFAIDLAAVGGRAPATEDVVEVLAAGDAAYELIGATGDTWYVRTDLAAPRGRIVALDPRASGVEGWREVVAEGDDAIEQAHLVGGHLVVVTLHDARNRITLFALDGRAAGVVPLPGICAVETVTGRQADDGFCYTVTSFTSSTAVCRHDLGTGAQRQLVAPGVALDPDEYVTEQVFTRSPDGTAVPLFLVHRRDVAPTAESAACQLGQDHPTLLYGYGGFGIAVTPVCKVEWLTWLERGGVLAVANLRGGGEYGEAWHEAAILVDKQRTFDDAIACAQWLLDHGWAQRSTLAVTGRSNGGLLAGALLTQRPDLFGAVVVEVGVLDMLRFQHFTVGWAWASDYGTAADAEQFAALHAYSPLHNVRDGVRYPATLVTTGDHDDRVVPGHSFKFAAALQHAHAGDEPIVLRVDTSAGHGAGKPTAKLVEERADVLAFLVRALT